MSTICHSDGVLTRHPGLAKDTLTHQDDLQTISQPFQTRHLQVRLSGTVKPERCQRDAGEGPPGRTSATKTCLRI